MRVEVVAVGSELVLGDVVDTNSAWLSRQLAAAGIECRFHAHVDDDAHRIAAALRVALERSDAVVVCGGLGPTADDVTREALAGVMGTALRRHPALLAALEAAFAGRGQPMPPSNARQAEVPGGARPLENPFGTAPGLRCPVGERVVYAVPGVPRECREVFTRAVLPELVSTSGSLDGPSAVGTRTLSTWGISEAEVAERVLRHLGDRPDQGTARPGVEIGFLASEQRGVQVRLRARGVTAAAVSEELDAAEAAVRAALGRAVFGSGDETVESVVAGRLSQLALRLALAESLTGGLVAARLVGVPGASRFFAGGVVAYDAAVKRDLLGVPPGPVVSASAAAHMAAGAVRALHADLGLALTGVAGPKTEEGQPVGTVFLGMAGTGLDRPASRALRLPGDRETVRQLAALSALDWLRRHLERLAGSTASPREPAAAGAQSGEGA